MASVDDSRIEANSQPTIGLVCGSASIWCCSTCIRWTGWTLLLRVPNRFVSRPAVNPTASHSRPINRASERRRRPCGAELGQAGRRRRRRRRRWSRHVPAVSPRCESSHVRRAGPEISSTARRQTPAIRNSFLHCGSNAKCLLWRQRQCSAWQTRSHAPTLWRNEPVA